MSKPEKTNPSQALDGALFLAQPASDGGITDGAQGSQSALPEEFGGMYRACYQAGQVSGWEAGYRLGYGAGFADGRRQGDAGSTAAAAAVENAPEKPASALRPGMHKARLFGLPCAECKRFLYNDEERCPYCRTPRAAAAEPPSAARG